MPRKTRKEVEIEKKRTARYDDATPRWLRELLAEESEVIREKRWQTPGRVYLQFSKKDAAKEEQRHEAIQRQRSRAGSRR